MREFIRLVVWDDMRRSGATQEPDPAVPGFKRFVIHPGPIDRPTLTWARGHFDSLQGRIEVAWRRAGREFELDLTVPPNTLALVHMPAAKAADITESGRLLADITEIKTVGLDGDRVIMAVPSGGYRFKSKVSLNADQQDLEK